ncbi:unnamed protein product [Phytomonas sp. Hart1]|nr:unnamed protein product [Phytomonas sp. Hart1]|eukprot:CCW69320.1 unnamed protein product [Phytomonas sp. isolate Hart1]
MQWRKRPHTRSPSLRAAPVSPFLGVNITSSDVYGDNQRRARQQILRDLLCHTSLVELRDSEILKWLEGADGWLRRSDFLSSELTELRLLVLGVLNTMPWWRIFESVFPLPNQHVNDNLKDNLGFVSNTHGTTSMRSHFYFSSLRNKSSLASGSTVASAPVLTSVSPVVSRIIRLHEHIQVAFEKVCLTLLEGSQRIIPNVLEVMLKPFNVEPSVREDLQCAIPADSILRVLNQIVTKSPASDVLNLFERCLPTLVPKRRWANARHHVVCTTLFLYLALEGQVPGYHPSSGNCQCLSRMQELFEEWIPFATFNDSVMSSPSISHASSQNISTRKNAAGEGRDCDVTNSNRVKLKEEADLVESKADFTLPPSLFSLTTSAAPTTQGSPSADTDTKFFQKVLHTNGQHSNPAEPPQHGVPKELSHVDCSGESPAPEGFNTSNGSFSTTIAASKREMALKTPGQKTLADFSDSEGANYSGSSDTNFGGQTRRDGAFSNSLFANSHHAGFYGGDRRGPHAGSSPKDILLSTVSTHPEFSTLAVIQTTPQNNRMLAYRSELIHFVLGRLEAMELSLDRTEGNLPNERDASLPYQASHGHSTHSMTSPTSPLAGWETARKVFHAEPPCGGGKWPSMSGSPSPMGSLPSTPGGGSLQGVSRGSRPPHSPLGSSHRSIGGFSSFMAPFSGARSGVLVVDSAQPQYKALRDSCAVVFYMLAKDLRRQQAAGVCGNVDWWRVLVGFHLRILASLSETPVCLHYIAPSLAMFGQEEEAVDMVHKVITIATKGSFSSSLRGVSSSLVAKEGFDRAPTSMGSAAVGAPVRLRMAAPLAMATSQGLSIPQRIRAAMSIAPLFKFMKDRIANGEGVRKRLLKWVVQEMGREAAVAGGRGAFLRLVEVVFAQCAAISSLMGVEIVPINNPNHSGSSAAEGSQTPLLQPVGGGAAKSTTELLQPFFDKYALNSDPNGSADKAVSETKRKDDSDDHCSGRMQMNLVQMEYDGLLHPWLMDECPWGNLLAQMISSAA